MSTHTIDLPAAVHLQGPLVGGDGDRHELVISGANGTQAHVRGTLDELALHAAAVAGPIVEARAALRAEATPSDDRAIVIDRDRLSGWAVKWSEYEYGSWGFVGSANDVVHLVGDLNDGDPDVTGWRTRSDVKGVCATQTVDDAVIAAVDVAGGFRICTTPQEDLTSGDLRGGELAVQVAERVADLLNQQFAAYRSTR